MLLIENSAGKASGNSAKQMISQLIFIGTECRVSSAWSRVRTARLSFRLASPRGYLYDSEMARRRTKNRTGLARIEGVPFHNLWVGFVCLRCHELNTMDVGSEILDPNAAFETAVWPCKKCRYDHCRSSDL